MPRITQSTTLDRVDHILGSGSGVLDFSVEGEDSYYTWEGVEDSDWEVEDVVRIENSTEDRFIIYPKKEYFVCEIETGGEEGDRGSVHCWCE